MRRKQQASKENYDHGTKQLSVLKPNDAIRIQVQNKWVPGVVIQEAETAHSYIVREPTGREYRKNHKHLQKVPEYIPVPIDIDDTNENAELQHVSSDHTSDPSRNITNRGCTIRAPVRYKDYVRH